MNISGVVVRTAPECLDQVLQDLGRPGLCQVHFKDEKGIVVVTVEGKDTEEELRKIRDISSIPNVFFADLAFTYKEDELWKAKDLFKDSSAVPEVLRKC